MQIEHYLSKSILWGGAENDRLAEEIINVQTRAQRLPKDHTEGKSFQITMHFKNAAAPVLW
jgi:hypothetical protein